MDARNSGVIEDVLALLTPTGSFNQPAFQAVVRKSFVDTGTTSDEDGKFRRYAATDTKGSFHLLPTGTVRKSDFPAERVNLAHLDNLIAEMINGEEDDTDL